MLRMEKMSVKMQTPFSVVKKEPANLQCELCNKIFTRSWLLKNHQRIHTGERPYKCSYCDKAFADKSNLRQHAKIHTTKEKLFQCQICQKTFAQRRYLMKHATEIHRDVEIGESIKGAGRGGKSLGPTRYMVQQPVSSQTVIETGKKEAANGKATGKQEIVGGQPNASADNKEKNYSEQDLKDFIKSNHKTMEKNGYIFIKQNFETLDTDTEPTLTEISEIPVQAISDTTLKMADFTKGNQLLKVNGKMVYLQMENKPATRAEILEAAKSKDGQSKVVKTDAQGKVTGALKGTRKIVSKNTYVRRHANILKSNSVKKAESDTVGLHAVKPISVPNMVKNVMRCVNPLQSITAKPEPLRLYQVLPQNPDFVLPVSMVQIPVGTNMSQIFHSPNIVTLSAPMTQQCGTTAIQNLKLSGVNCVSLDSSAPRPDNLFSSSTLKSESVVEIQHVETVDEKGAAGDMGVTSVTTTPIVSDAPWQGVLNINSEQELMEYITSQSSTAVDTDQSYTIFIQNVDTQNGAVLSSSLDSQNLLSGTGLSSVFTDQGTMISDILPVVSSVEEAQVHSSPTEEPEMIHPILDGAEDHMNGDSEIKSSNIIEIRTDGEPEESCSDLVGVDKIIKIEIDSDLVQVSDGDEIQDEISVVKIETAENVEIDEDGILTDNHTQHLSGPDESPENSTGQLLIKEDVESDHLHESGLAEQTVAVDAYSHETSTIEQDCS